MSLSWAFSGVALVAFAFLLRVAVHHGRQPGGVDTWYYLAYADALRRSRRLDAPMPQYLLQDRAQSYPPLFPVLLALVPPRWRDRWFWLVSPAVDCLHLGLLYWLSYRITDNLAVALVTGIVYALTPQLVAETRSLNARSFGALLHTLATVLCLRHVMFEDGGPWMPLALAAGTGVWLGSATGSAAYGLVAATLAVVFRQPRFLLVPSLALLLALTVSRGHLFRVFANYRHAVAYIRRNRGRFGAHPIRHSPLYGEAGARPSAESGVLGRTRTEQLVRLLGENPFLPALLFAARGVPVWGIALYWWAVCLAGLSVLTTVVQPLRVLGPGRSFIKMAAFPVAYTLAISLGTPAGLARPVGLATIAGMAASVAALVVFYRHVRTRETEQTASVPPDLAEAARALEALPPGSVFCLPYMYADYVCYHARKPVLWGGHCGDLRRLEALTPVIRRPIPELLREYGVRYVMVDLAYARPSEIGLASGLATHGTWGSFALYEVEEAQSAASALEGAATAAAR